MQAFMTEDRVLCLSIICNSSSDPGYVLLSTYKPYYKADLFPPYKVRQMPATKAGGV